MGSGSGSGDKSLLNFYIHVTHLLEYLLHHHHHNNNSHQRQQHGSRDFKGTPKGCVAILVGQGEDLQRFIIPVIYINHPLFMQLLKEAEEEYGFDQKGPINIPCHVEEFRHVQGIIDKEKHHHTHRFLCFKA